MMFNLIVFIITVLLYGTLANIAGFGDWPTYAVLAVCSIPFNVGGNIFTLTGNGKARKSFYSLFSIFQWAEAGNARSLVALVQFAENKAFAFMSWFQVVQSDALVGLVLLQYANRSDSMISGWQISDTRAVTLFSVWQECGDSHRSFATFSSLSE